MKLREKKWIRFRIYLVAIFFSIGLGTVLTRAYQLQILEKEHLEKIARSGYIGIKKIPSKRGTIYDRNGHELALSIKAGSVYAHPNRIKDKDKTARQLSKILGESYPKISRLLKSRRPFVWVKRKIAADLAQRIRNFKLEGVGVTDEMRRYYPGKEIAAHLIGFVGSENQGLEGLEKKYDEILTGPQNTIRQMRDALLRSFSIIEPTSSENRPCDLVLTIDKDIQYKAQEYLRFEVERAGAKSGQCIVVDPKTGEILAMAVVPEFNPNIFLKYRPEQWRNRAVTDCYEPGSTVKTFLLAAALEEGVIKPTTRLDCENGSYRIADHTIHDSHRHGTLNVSEIIALSSNIGAIKIGQKLGYKKFCEYLRNFGFGIKTGINIMGERNGYIREASEKRPVDQASLFFGQGMTATSLQIAMGMAAIANGGNLMKPHIIRAIKDRAGHILYKTYPEVARKVISEKTAREVTNILMQVVSKKGTGKRAAVKGFDVAGKTGTAQKVDPRTGRYSKKRYVATFVGFVPTYHPKLVILVMIDEPGGIPYGGIIAAPVFKKIALWSLNYLGVPPQISAYRSCSVYSPRPSQHGTYGTKSKNGSIPNFTGMGIREVLRKGKALGLQVILEGTGLAFKQYPRPGVPVKGINTVKISFKPPT